jgi:restriction system protein
MRRRRKSSPLEHLIEVLALLPCWACLMLALLSYAMLSALAKPVPMVAVQPGQTHQIVTVTLWKTFAMIGQYLIPFACLLAALGSAFGRRHRSNLVSQVAAGTDASVLEGMSWREFEMLIGEGFRLQGFQVTERDGDGPDGGVDLVLRKGTEKFLVQCKQWKAFKVGVQTVRELYGVMAAEHATGGFVVTSGRFSEDAIEFARGRNVTLMDGPMVFALIKQAQNDRRQRLPSRRSGRRLRRQLRRPTSTGHPAALPVRGRWSFERRSEGRTLADRSGGVRPIRPVAGSDQNQHPLASDSHQNMGSRAARFAHHQSLAGPARQLARAMRPKCSEVPVLKG